MGLWLLLILLAGLLVLGQQAALSFLAPRSLATVTTPLPSPTARHAAISPTPTPESSPTARPAAAMLAEADAYRRNGDYAKAIVGYLGVITQQPEGAEAREARFRMAESYLLNRQYEAAVETWLLYLDRYPDGSRYTDALFFLARAYRALGQERKAIGYLQDYASRPNALKGYAYFQMGLAYQGLEDQEEARRAFERVLEEEVWVSVIIDAMEKIAESYLEEEEYQIAIDWYQQILNRAKNPGYRATIKLAIASAYLRLGESDTARDILLELVEAQSDTAIGARAAELLTLDELGPYYQGLAYFNLENYPSAISAFQRYIDEVPQGQYVVVARQYIAQSYRREDDYQQAVAEYRRLADLHPTSYWVPDALWQAGRLLEWLSRYGEAATEYGRLYRAYPAATQAADAAFREGLCYYKLGEYEKARTVWQLSLTNGLAPEARARSLFWMGKAFSAEDKAQEARRLFQEAAAVKPWDYYSLRAAAQWQPNRYSDGSELFVLQESDEREQLERWFASWMPWVTDESDLGVLGANIAQDANFRRGVALLGIGLYQEAMGELSEVVGRFRADTIALYQLALYFREERLYSLSIWSASLLLNRSPVPSLYYAPRLLQKLLYPAYFRDLVEAEARRVGLSPSLLFSLIRQESWFNQYAHSGADALGLTQVIPSTAWAIAESLDEGEFQLDDLYKPYVSIRFGAWFLATQLRAWDNNLLLALAAYNGGSGNVQRWRKALPVPDDDLFVEEIRYSETYSYVKRVYEATYLYQDVYFKSSPYEERSTKE